MKIKNKFIVFFFIMMTMISSVTAYFFSVNQAVNQHVAEIQHLDMILEYLIDYEFILDTYKGYNRKRILRQAAELDRKITGLLKDDLWSESQKLDLIKIRDDYSELHDIFQKIKKVSELNKGHLIPSILMNQFRFQIMDVHELIKQYLFTLHKNMSKSQADVQIALILKFAVFLISLFSILIFVRKVILNPLLKVGVAATELGGGNLSFRLQMKRKDEIGFLGNSFDNMASRLQATIDDLAQKEKELKNSNIDLKRSNSELEQFAYVASHDLQEPLRMVASYTQLIEERYIDQLDEKAKKFIDYAVEGARRMQVLINDLLKYSRVGTRHKPFEKIDCNELIGEVLHILEASIKESGVNITVDKLPTVEAERAQLVLVFQNLVGNAVKFVGKKKSGVKISAEKKGKFWEFKVKDNGIGIKEEFHERIFVIFQRLHGREEYSGSGIGLSVVKKIVEGHGGTIKVKSNENKGAEFIFTIPA